MAAGLLIGTAFLTEPTLAIARRRRAARPGAAGAAGARIVLADYDRLVVTHCGTDGTVCVLRPPGVDPQAILLAARLVLAQDRYEELAASAPAPTGRGSEVVRGADPRCRISYRSDGETKRSRLVAPPGDRGADGWRAVNPELVVAAADAGAVGFLAAGYKTPAAMAAEIAAVRAASPDRFGVNLFVPGLPSTEVESITEYVSSLAAHAEAVDAPPGRGGLG